MTLGVELIHVYDDTTIDLTGTNTEDYFRVEDSWVPVAYEVGGAPIQEIIPMLAVGTAAQIKAALDKLDKYLEIATLWADDKSRRKWVKMSLEEAVGGTIVYRTVLGGIAAPTTLTGNDTFLDAGTGENKYRFNLQLEVMPGWEVHDTAETETTAFIDRYGGQDTLTNADGTRPAQIEYFTNVDDNPLIGDMWIGIRDEREGLSDFQALLPLDGGNAPGGGGFSGQSKISSTYGYWFRGSVVATNDMLVRVEWNLEFLSPAPTFWDHYHGRYLVLIRAMMDDNGAGEKVRMQLHWGFGPENETQNPPVVLSTDGTWTLIPLGYVVMPPWPNWSTSAHDMRNFTFRIFIGGLVGSAMISVDAMCLIPADHMFTMETDIDHVFRKIHAWTRRDWHAFAYGKDANTWPKSGFPHHFQNWSLPTGSSEIVIALTEWWASEKISPSPGASDLRWQVQRIGKVGFPFVT